MCHFHSSPILTLRGLCKEIDVDTIYSLKYSNNDLIFKGIRNSEIRKNGDVFTISYLQNHIMQNKSNNFIPFPIGKIWWKFIDNAKSCFNGEDNKEISLKLTACPEGYFTCNNGECIIMEKRCDQLLNCDDETDEINCEILLLKPSYRKMAPPSRVEMTNERDTVIPSEVTISMTMLDIVAIRETENEIEIKFKVIFRWFEFRAFFQNLKKIDSQNTLEAENVDKLWIPDLVYINNKENDGTLKELSMSHLKIIRNGNFTRSSTDEVDEIEIFKGSENPIIMVQSYTKTFKCRYELRAFPFDTQVTKRMVILK